MLSSSVKRPLQSRGFALVISLVVMAFTLVLILSLTSLIQVERKTANYKKYKVTAEQNALLALKQAIGTIQTTLGPDQRVSATASILGNNTAPSKRHMTGVWSTTPNLNGNSSSTPVWLLSGANNAPNFHEAELDLKNSIQLVGPVNMSGADAVELGSRQVFAPLEPVDPAQDNEDRISWWIGDEGIKANIQLSSITDSKSLQKSQKLAAIHTLSSSNRSNIAALENLSHINLQEYGIANKLNKINDLELLSPHANVDVLAHFHALTTRSYGVLSDCKHGGLKVDLSLAFEMTDQDFANTEFGEKGENTRNPDGFMWGVEPIFTMQTQPPFSSTAYGPCWNLLKDYYTIYRRMETPMTQPTFNAQTYYPTKNIVNSSMGSEEQFATVWTENTDAPDPLSTINGPIMVKASYLPYNIRSQHRFGIFFQDSQDPQDPPNTVEPFMNMRSHFVYHNPFNVRLHHKALVSELDHFRFSIETRYIDSDTVVSQSGETSGNWARAIIQNSLDSNRPFQPGEVLVYEGTRYLNNKQDYSSLGNNAKWFSPRGNGTLAIGESATKNGIKVPNGFVEITAQPTSTSSYNYWHYNMMESEGDTFSVTDDQSGANGDLFRKHLTVYNGFTEEFASDTNNWWGTGETIKANVNTSNHMFDPDTDKFDTFTDYYEILSLDTFIKPAEYEPDHISSSTQTSLRYPAYVLSNPLAPVITNKNLLPDGTGFPHLNPSMQIEILGNSSLGTVDASPNGQASWGNAHDSYGNKQVCIIDLPTSPPLSLGQFQNANLGLYAHMPALAIGNSFATPFIAADQTSASYLNKAGNNRILYDLSYLMNEALWDRYFLSSYSIPYDAIKDNFDDQASNVGDLYDAVFTNQMSPSLPNARMQQIFTSGESIASIRDKLFNNNQPKLDSYHRSAENLMVKGAFNVNSVSVEAWTALLTSARDAPIYLYNETQNPHTYTQNSTPINRLNQPIKGEYENDETSETAWAGFRNLKDSEVKQLADAIVNEIKLRVANVNGDKPYRSLSDFVNRNLSNDEYGRRGLLQAAIEKSKINGEENDSFQTSYMSVTQASLETSVGSFPHAKNIRGADGKSLSAGAMAPAYLLQGDILQAIGSFISVRSDTFRIRAYGDHRDPITKEIIGQAWCEAIVQRIPKPVHPSDLNPNSRDYWTPKDPDVTGRKFTITNFRWLNPTEI